METDWNVEDPPTPKVTSLTSLDTGVRPAPSGAAYVAERNTCLNLFSRWNETDQVEFVEQLLARMCHYQHGHINAYLKPMLQRDFISMLPKKGLDHVAENILSYLDANSLCAAELVCREWQRVISEGMLWKKLVERKVRTDSLWRGLAERRGWILYLFKPKPGCQHPSHSFYRQLYPKIIQDIQSIEDNWRMGRHNLQRINCRSENSKGVYCLQYDDNKIVSGLRDNTIKIWDRKTLQCVKELQGHTGSVLCLQYDERAIISGSSDSTVRVWDVNTGAMLNTLIHHCEAVLHLRFCNGMMVTCSKDRSIAVWDMTSTTEIMLRRVLVGHRAAVNVVDFDEKYIVSASGDRTIKVWNTSSCEFVRTLNGHKRGIACLQYRDRLVVSGSSDNTIRLWDIECGQCIRVLEGHEELVRCIRFDNKRIVSGAYDGKIKVWDLRAALDVRTPHQDLCLRTLVEHTGRVFRLQFDEFQIVSSSHDDTILVWDFLNCGGSPPAPAPAPAPAPDHPACPYSKQFVHTKSSQYKKMKLEWRNNVYLARSKIQGLGLYAARDLEKHTMVIEYIGELIRSELSEIREKQYEAKNRGIYMFRLDERRVVDATLSGGLARYINHSCQPNCVAETVEVDRHLRIIIFAKRRIARGEELAYDYKFDIEDDAHKIMCMCGAPNCRKWMN